MSDRIVFAAARRSARATQHAGWLAGGTLVVYAAPQPDDADEAVTTQTALVAFALPDPFGAENAGVLTATTLAAAPVTASGTAAWARAYDALDAIVGDYQVGSVGSGAAIEMDNLSLVSGGYATAVSYSIVEG